MNCNWIELPLGDLIELKRGYDLPKSKRCHGNIPIVSSAGISDFHADSKVQAPGVVTGRYGTIGEVFYVEENFWPLNTTLYVKDFKGNCPEYVYYLLKTFDFHKYSDKAAVPGVNRNHLHMEMVRVPSDYDCQKKIASYLSKLDKKISLNTDVNNTLAEIAQAIFKSWFVDFDPVKAKMNGEQPEGMDAATASLFPDKLVESELGLIPEGWEVKNVGEFTDTFDYVANGSFAALKANVELFDEPNDVLYVRTTDFNKGFKNDLKYTNESSYQFLSKSKLYGHETIISNVGDVGTVFRAPSWYDMPMTLGSNAMGIVAKDANSYIYYLFKSHTGQHLLDGITSGSAQMKFNKTSFRKLRVILPSNELLVKFEDLEASLWAKHASNQKESLHLEKLRDTLLPKLLSGEIELTTE